MVHVYKLCEKSSNNPSGVIEVENPVNLKKPVLICLTPQGNVEKNTFGIITKGARAARVRTEEELAGGFKLDEMPVDFLGIRADKMENISDFTKHNFRIVHGNKLLNFQFEGNRGRCQDWYRQYAPFFDLNTRIYLFRVVAVHVPEIICQWQQCFSNQIG